jgi:hypothetical protein
LLSALDGVTESELSLGNKFLHGIADSVPASYETASMYYITASNRAFEEFSKKGQIIEQVPLSEGVSSGYSGVQENL